MKHFGLIGNPLEHSFSVRYFTDKFRNEQINADYRNFPMKEVSGLRELIKEERLSGLNVTLPHKEAVLPLLDQLDPIADSIGAVNTIKVEGQSLIGINTDVIGFERTLHPDQWNSVKYAVILGTGGASKAVRYVLEQKGIQVAFVSRQPEKDEFSYQTVDLKKADLLVNTTPLGTYPNIHTFPPLAYELLQQHCICIDLTYNPTTTEFMKKCAEQGAVTHNGLIMLMEQAEASWRIWTNEVHP